MARLSEGRQTVNSSRKTKLRIRASRGNIASDQDFKTEQADGRHFRRKQSKCPGLQGETTSENRAVGSKEGSKSRSTMKGNTPMASTIISCPRRSRSSDLALSEFREKGLLCHGSAAGEPSRRIRTRQPFALRRALRRAPAQSAARWR